MTKTGVQYKHISFAERVKIETLLDARYGYQEVADVLGRSVQTVYHEVRRNMDSAGQYQARVAQDQCVMRRRMVNRKVHRKLVEGTGTYKTFLRDIAHYHSPDQIIARHKKSSRFKVRSPQTIYTYIATQQPELKRYLRRGTKRYRKDHNKAKYLKFTSKKAQHSIENRPAIVEKRRRVGDWEGDTIIGAEKTSRILTCVDRKTGYLIAKKIDGDVSGTVARKTIHAFSQLPRKKRRTITYDNGVEFAEYLCIEKALNMDVYFAHPYHSWERGTNENTNGLLRQFYPKGTPFKNITQRDLDKKVKLINNRPRKRLNYRTPAEVF